MPVKEIVTDKNKLSNTCRECSISFHHVVDDLMDTCNFNKFNCAGLAANQIGYDLRVFVVKIKNKFTPMVNPKYVTRSKSFRLQDESCLSFPGVISKMKKRHQSIKISYFDPIKNKQIKSKKLKNFDARIFQHEMDHLNGILI